jgi:hypothetical protein
MTGQRNISAMPRKVGIRPDRPMVVANTSASAIEMWFETRRRARGRDVPDVRDPEAGGAEQDDLEQP